MAPPSRLGSRTFLALLVLAAIGFGLAFFVRAQLPDQRREPSPSGAAGSASGIPDRPPYPIDLRGTRFTSPAGRQFEEGDVDELGYVMPLDVRRPRPERALGTAPDRAAILARRAAAARAAGSFEEHRVSPDDGHTQNETAIDTDQNTVIAAFHTYTDTALLIALSRSVDGGHVWQGSVVSGSHTNLTDPCIKAAGGGRWHLSYIASGGIGGADLDVFVRTSTDGGSSFGAPVFVTNDANFDDKPYMAARGMNVLVGYADFGFSPAKVRAVRSTDGGASFANDTILAVNSVGGNGACPVIDGNGTFHMFWRDSFQDSLWVSRSTDQGQTWSADRGIVEMFPLPSQLPGGFRIINLPSAAADPVTGALVVVWNDQRFGNPDILSIRSTDGGVTWSAPIRVNDDAGVAAQFFPWIAFDPHGVAHVGWYDRREDGFKIDFYAARSIDGGATFEANQRVTAAAYTPVLPWDTAVAFLGDYNAIAANATTVYPCFQDAREGNQDVYVALVPGGPISGVAGGSGAPPATPVLTAAPSPFSGRVKLRSAEHGGRTIDIADVTGRHVRTIELGPDGSTFWDGHDASGAPAARGVYLARVRGTTSEAIRLVKLD